MGWQYTRLLQMELTTNILKTNMGSSLNGEPWGALVAAEGGLADIQAIVAGSPDHLHPGGMLLLEHGCDQGAAVRELLAAHGFANVQTRRDIAGHERVTGGAWHVE